MITRPINVIQGLDSANREFSVGITIAVGVRGRGHNINRQGRVEVTYRLCRQT